MEATKQTPKSELLKQMQYIADEIEGMKAKVEEQLKTIDALELEYYRLAELIKG